MRAAQALIEGNRDLSALAGNAFQSSQAAYPPRRSLPAVDKFLQDDFKACATTIKLVEAIRTAARDLNWRQTYTSVQVSEDFLSGYAWFDLVGPDGPIQNTDRRISVGYWHHGLEYPEHWHAPEEMYCVLAGSARFKAKGRKTRYVVAGDLVHHASKVPHSMSMTDSSLLAMAIWKGTNLSAPSHMVP